MKKLIKNNNKGILFWITGLSGSGKTGIAEKIKNNISNPQYIGSADWLQETKSKPMN